MSDSKCIFCKIIGKKEFAAIIYEDEDVMAFMDIRPVNEGHALIVPKKHEKYVTDLDEELFLKLFPIGYRIAKRIKEVYPEITDFNFLIADGENAGQEIPHVHLHVIPRQKRDGFGFKLPKGFLIRLISKEERKRVRDKLVPI
ncbi:MAG: HIT family protein [Asgard group archaeon]|nr:HIT family protein [Asgard group archaeon]